MSETNRPRNILRSIGAVLAGVVAVFILSVGTDVVLHATGIYPPWFQPMSNALFLVATVYRTVYAIACSYLAARLAPDRPMLHAMVFGFVGLVLSIAGVVGTWNRGPEFGPNWYPLALVATALPCTWAGGRLRIMRLRALSDGS